MAGRKQGAKRYPYAPDYTTEPGEILQETIEALGMTQKELASRTGYTPKHINQLISGVARITQDAALRLESVTGVPAHFWNNLECQYQEQNAKLDAAARAQEELEWLNEIPVKELMKRGALPRTSNKLEQLTSVLGFFQVASVKAWRTGWSQHQIAFRKAAGAEKCTGAIAAWIRIAEQQASRIDSPSYQSDQFDDALKEARLLTTEPPEVFVPKLQDLCARSGVALVLVPEIPGGRVSGAARWLGDDRAMIALNLRGKGNDRFWFTFFHEAGHILNDDRSEVFIDVDYSEDPRECRANEFAAETLIPSLYQKELQQLTNKSSVRMFAERIKIHPGIVVGRLQHDRLIPFSHMNDLKCRFQWSV